MQKKLEDAKFEARAILWPGQTKFEAKNEVRPILRPDQAIGARPGKASF